MALCSAPRPPELEPVSNPQTDAAETAEIVRAPVHEDRLWSDDGWTAKVIKNEEDDGWAVSMTLDGQSEPSLVGPWTMGRDKKNPKPLDANAFTTLVKTASEIIRRHIRVNLDIVPDEDSPYAELSAFDDSGDELARERVAPNFRFNHDVASAWVTSGFARHRSGD